MPETLLIKRLRYRCFHVNLVKFLRAPFTERICVTASDIFHDLITARRRNDIVAIFYVFITSKEAAKFSIVVNK